MRIASFSSLAAVALLACAGSAFAASNNQPAMTSDADLASANTQAIGPKPEDPACEEDNSGGLSIGVGGFSFGGSGDVGIGASTTVDTSSDDCDDTTSIGPKPEDPAINAIGPKPEDPAVNGTNAIGPKPEDPNTPH